MSATPQAWDGALHCCHELELESVGMKFAAFAEAVARVAVELRAPAAADAAALHSAVEGFLHESPLLTQRKAMLGAGEHASSSPNMAPMLGSAGRGRKDDRWKSSPSMLAPTEEL
mmetsp:Transcript_25432/g.68150  ORF Transcript_25432/g.68150 Transcript_25432/m.68150 type:complete len:115 (-) Transcript_25432:146-490(-)